MPRILSATIPRQLKSIHGQLLYDRFMATLEQNGAYGPKEYGHVPGTYLPRDLGGSPSSAFPRRVFRMRTGEYISLVRHKPCGWWVWQVEETAIIQAKVS